MCSRAIFEFYLVMAHLFKIPCLGILSPTVLLFVSLVPLGTVRK